jgi:hypothetical protein
MLSKDTIVVHLLLHRFFNLLRAAIRLVLRRHARFGGRSCYLTLGANGSLIQLEMGIHEYHMWLLEKFRVYYDSTLKIEIKPWG